jgi:hypothetical protein
MVLVNPIGFAVRWSPGTKGGPKQQFDCDSALRGSPGKGKGPLRPFLLLSRKLLKSSYAIGYKIWTRLDQSLPSAWHRTLDKDADNDRKS